MNHQLIWAWQMAHLCPEIHAVTKVTDLTRRRQTEWMFIDLTILTNFRQICQSEISLAELTILATFLSLFCKCLQVFALFYIIVGQLKLKHLLSKRAMFWKVRIVLKPFGYLVKSNGWRGFFKKIRKRFLYWKTHSKCNSENKQVNCIQCYAKFRPWLWEAFSVCPANRNK